VPGRGRLRDGASCPPPGRRGGDGTTCPPDGPTRSSLTPRSRPAISSSTSVPAPVPSLVAAGARVVAVELHPQRIGVLRKRFAHDPVTVVCADAAGLRLPRRPFRVVANPPFAASTAILRRLLAPGSRLVAADVVLPHWVGRRWARGKAPGAGRWSRDHTIGLGSRIPRAAFTPHAASDCTRG
jgi:23S rRNA (adenine-N6)-dimethyltransferase